MKRIVLSLVTAVGLLAFAGSSTAALLQINLSDISNPPQDNGVNSFGPAYGLNGATPGRGVIGDTIENLGGGVEEDTSGSPELTHTGLSANMQGWFGLTVTQNRFADSITGVWQETTPGANLSGGFALQVYELAKGTLDIMNDTVYNLGAPIAAAGVGTPLALSLFSTKDYLVRVYGTVPGSLLDPRSFQMTAKVVTIPQGVPVPAAVWLFGTAIFGLLGLRRKFAKESLQS